MPRGRLKTIDRTELLRISRLGGLASAAVRTTKLSPERRSEIARIAAAARWHNACKRG